VHSQHNFSRHSNRYLFAVLW